ncbi:MAG: hypothetical protein WCE38_17935 [Burkholderiales bacterium]
MKTTEYLFVTLASVVACAAILTVRPATAEETQTGSPAAERESVAEVTAPPEVALPTSTASDASQHDDVRDDAEADTRRWPDEDDEPEDR